MKHLEKVLSRPANLAALMCFDLGISQYMKKILGFGFTTVCHLLKNGALSEYRAKEEMLELKNALEQIFFNNPQKINQLLVKFKKDYYQMEKLVYKLEALKNKKVNLKLVIKFINDFNQAYLRIWPPVMLIFWLPLWLKEKKLSSAEKIRLHKMIKARYARDKELVLAQRFYDNIFILIKRYNQQTKYNLEVFTPSELIYLFKKGMLDSTVVKEINKRQAGCIIFRGKVYPVYRYPDLKEFFKKYGLAFPQEKKVRPRTTFKGMVSYPGYVKGIVKLLFSKNDMLKIKKGDIAVSPMTTSYFDPVFKKVKALITDEGGIICHAAIVSRELGIPCIIGTKIATQVLKDGDLVEVDATKGVVRKLSK